MLGQYESAISIAQRACEDFREIGDVLYEAKLDMGIGQARLAQGLLEEAVDILYSALERLQKAGAPHAQAECFWLLGRARCEAGQLEEAAGLLEHALEMVRAIGDRDDEFRVLTDIARLKTQSGAAEDGLQAANEATVIAQQLSNQHGLGMTLVEKARAYLKLKQPDAALPVLEQAIAILNETQSGEAWRAYWLLASILQCSGDDNAGNTKKARGALDQALKRLEEIREELGAADETRRTAATHARADVAKDLHAMLMRDGQALQAKQVARSWLLE
jgi:tetratricopeptide (TPR) repeat protein